MISCAFNLCTFSNVGMSTHYYKFCTSQDRHLQEARLKSKVQIYNVVGLLKEDQYMAVIVVVVCFLLMCALWITCIQMYTCQNRFRCVSCGKLKCYRCHSANSASTGRVNYRNNECFDGLGDGLLALMNTIAQGPVTIDHDNTS